MNAIENLYNLEVIVLYNSNNEVSLGHFIDFNLWSEAIKLIDFQVKLKKKNKHFNTLNIIYFEKIKAYLSNKLLKQDYFEERVSSNIFYGLEQEYFIYSYPRPKSITGIRSYQFFSYPLRAIHYAIGLYILKLSEEFIIHCKSKKHIYSFILFFLFQLAYLYN